MICAEITDNWHKPDNLNFKHNNLDFLATVHKDLKYKISWVTSLLS